MKIIKIDKCAKCIYYDAVWYSEPIYNYVYCNKMKRELKNLIVIPTWCPLENYFNKG